MANVRVVRIEPAGTMDVYNMEVETTHDFAVNNGCIVHNCYDEARYALMEHPLNPRKNEKPPLDMDDPLNQRNNPEWKRS